MAQDYAKNKRIADAKERERDERMTAPIREKYNQLKNALIGNNAPVQPRTGMGMTGSGYAPYTETNAVTSPVGTKDVMDQSIRSLNMGSKSRSPTPSDFAKDDEMRGITKGPGGIDADSFKKGGKVKKMSKGGNVASSASKRADGIAQRGKTKGRMV